MGVIKLGDTLSGERIGGLTCLNGAESRRLPDA